MARAFPVFLIAILFLYFAHTSPLPNGSHLLANQQFEASKRAFNQQDYFLAERQANLAGFNSPDSAAPWLLTGNCLYLQGQDQAAWYHYARALALDPHIGHFPPFFENLRLNPRVKTVLTLSPKELIVLRKKIGQMIMVSVPGTILSSQKKMMLNAGWVGGVILFAQNIQTKTQIAGYIRQLQANSPTPLFVAVDQEGGAVRRFREENGFQRLPSLAALGQTKSPNLAYRFGILSGMQLKAVGANLNLAPVVDIDHGLPNSIISKYHRSLGSDPEMVSDLAQQIIRGMKAENIIATAKHFPTQSIALVNPHEERSETDVPLAELEKTDLIPYSRLIQNHLLDAVMLSHVVYKNIDPFFPASLSPEMIQNLLRGQMGYKGLVISDDLRMNAIKEHFPLDVSVVQAVNAGVDVLLVTDNLEQRVMDSLVKAVESGKVSLKTVDVAYQRIMGMKSKYGLLASVPRLQAEARAPAPKPPAEEHALDVPDHMLKRSGALSVPIPKKGIGASVPRLQASASRLQAEMRGLNVPNLKLKWFGAEARALGVPTQPMKKAVGALSKKKTTLPAGNESAPRAREKTETLAQKTQLQLAQERN